MRSRSEIKYLSLLGLSLTVVIAIQYRGSGEGSVEPADAKGRHIYIVSADYLKAAFKSSSCYNPVFSPSYKQQVFSVLQHPLELIVKLKPGHPSLLKRLEKLNNQQDSSTESDIDFASLLLESELLVSSLKGRIFNSANISFSEGSRMLNSPVRAGPLV
jgi:hypothetical protein